MVACDQGRYFVRGTGNTKRGGKIELQRYKGLGEMNESQLWELWWRKEKESIDPRAALLHELKKL